MIQTSPWLQAFEQDPKTTLHTPCHTILVAWLSDSKIEYCSRLQFQLTTMAQSVSLSPVSDNSNKSSSCLTLPLLPSLSSTFPENPFNQAYGNTPEMTPSIRTGQRTNFGSRRVGETCDLWMDLLGMFLERLERRIQTDSDLATPAQTSGISQAMPSPEDWEGLAERVEQLQLENSALAASICNIKCESAKVRQDFRKTRAELKARRHREEKLVAKILALESAVAVIRQQRDTAQTFGFCEHERANAVHHMYYKEEYPHDALVIGVFRSTSEPDVGAELEDLGLSDFSDYDDMDDNTGIGLGLHFD